MAVAVEAEAGMVAEAVEAIRPEAVVATVSEAWAVEPVVNVTDTAAATSRAGVSCLSCGDCASIVMLHYVDSFEPCLETRMMFRTASALFYTQRGTHAAPIRVQYTASAAAREREGRRHGSREGHRRLLTRTLDTGNCVREEIDENTGFSIYTVMLPI